MNLSEMIFFFCATIFLILIGITSVIVGFYHLIQIYRLLRDEKKKDRKLK